MSSEEQRRGPEEVPGENPGDGREERQQEDFEAVGEGQGSPADPAETEPADEADRFDAPPEDLLEDEIAADVEDIEGAGAPRTEPTGDEVLEEAVVEEAAAAEAELAATLEELEAARGERDKYKDDVRYWQAEFDNARKRQERELASVRQNAAERLVAELLPVLDNLDRALESEGDIREGVRATRDQMMEVLGREGLLPIASDGQAFDPNVHEAVMSQPSEEHEEGTVLQTFQRGYALNGRAIRPAKVVVAH